jgi:hypothetical protein
VQLRYLTEKKIIQPKTQEREILAIRFSVKFQFRGRHVSLIFHPFTTPYVPPHMQHITVLRAEPQIHSTYRHHHGILKSYKHRDRNKRVEKWKVLDERTRQWDVRESEY